MAYDIGAKIGIEGESAFRDTINKINTNMRTLDTELQKVTSQFDKNDQSIESYSAKNEVLNKKIIEQKNKLDELKKGLALANDKYGESDKVTQSWQQAVNKATADLNTMEREVKNNTKAMDGAGNAIKDLGKDFDNAGAKALTFSDVLKANIIGNFIVDGVKAVGNAFKDLASNALDSADSIQQMADKTGMSAETIQEWQYVGDALGTSIETITGAQAKLTKSMSASEKGTGAQAEAFKKLKINAFDPITGAMRDSKVVMREALDALGDVANETERDSLAMQLFGKSAMDLNPLIKAGAGEIKNLAKQARDTGSIMSGDTVSSLDNFGDTIGQLKQSAQSMAGTLLSELTPSIQPLIEKIRNIDTKPITEALKWLLENSGSISTGLVAIGTGFATFQVVSMIQGVVGAIKAFQLANEGATIAQWALNVAMNANPIGILIAVIAALVAGIIVLWKTNDNFRNTVIKAWDSIKGTGLAVFGWLKKFFTEDIPRAFNIVINFFKNNWKEILLFITNPIAGALALLYKINPKFREWVDGLWKTIVNTIKSIGDINWGEVGINIIKGIAVGVTNAAKNLANAVINAAKKALNGIKNFLGIHSPSRKMRDEVGQMIGLGMAEGITDSTRKVTEAMQGLNNKIIADGTLNIKGNSNRTTIQTVDGATQSGDIVINNYTTLDGKVVAESTSRVQARNNRALGRALGVIPV